LANWENLGESDLRENKTEIAESGKEGGEKKRKRRKLFQLPKGDAEKSSARKPQKEQ